MEKENEAKRKTLLVENTSKTYERNACCIKVAQVIGKAAHHRHGDPIRLHKNSLFPANSVLYLHYALSRRKRMMGSVR